jgi:hypothetical protein
VVDDRLAGGFAVSHVRILNGGPFCPHPRLLCPIDPRCSGDSDLACPSVLSPERAAAEIAARGLPNLAYLLGLDLEAGRLAAEPPAGRMKSA